jgi:hypothetical protein
MNPECCKDLIAGIVIANCLRGSGATFRGFKAFSFQHLGNGTALSSSAWATAWGRRLPNPGKVLNLIYF